MDNTKARRLIDANALMDDFRKYMVERYDREKCVSEENCKACENSCLWRKKVSADPTVDAVEVVHAHWYKAPHHPYRCSNCGEMALLDMYGESHYRSNYCPNCGAKMDKEES